MARFRTERDGGVRDAETGRVIRPADPEWAAVYRPWLEAGNDPDPPEQRPATSIEELRAVLRSRVDETREAALRLGVAWGGHRWDVDPRSQALLSSWVAAAGAGVPLPGGFTWRTADNDDVPLGRRELLELAAAMLGHVQAVYARAWALKAQIDVSSAPEAVDLREGWPTPFSRPAGPRPLPGGRVPPR